MGADGAAVTCIAVAGLGADAGIVTRVAVVALAGVDAIDAGAAVRLDAIGAAAAAVGVDAIDFAEIDFVAAADELFKNGLSAGTDSVARAGCFCVGTGGRKTAVRGDDDPLSAAWETAGEKNKIASAKASDATNSLPTLPIIPTTMSRHHLPFPRPSYTR